MKIHKIILENFASYKKEIFDFDKLGQVVNIYGPTGSGKTTLIVDSITFCLFGNAYNVDRQGTTKLVINPKFNEAKCEIEFSIYDKKYKVSRTVYKNSPANALFYEEKDGNFIKKAISVTEVDRIISSLIKFDYSTFLNSIMVRQGDVMRFLESNPKERREILLKAFNLDFSKYLERAKELRQETTNKINNIELEIKESKNKIEREGEINNQLLTIRKDYENKNEILKKLQELKEKYDKEKELLTIKKTKIEKEIEQIEYIKEEINELSKEHNDLLQKLDDIKNKIKNENKFKQEKDNLEKIKKELIMLQDKINLIKIKETEISGIKDKISRIEKDLLEIQRHREELEDAKKAKKILDELYEKLQDIEIEEDEIKEKITRTNIEIEEANKILELLLKKETSECPVCKSKLTPEHRNELIKEYNERIYNLNSEIQKQNIYLEYIKKEKEKLENESKKLEKKVNIIEFLENLIREKNENDLKNQLENLNKDLVEKENELKKQKEDELFKIHGNDFRQIQNRLQECEKKIVELSNELAKIDEYKKSLPDIQKSIADLESKIEEKEKKIKEEDSLKLELDKIEYEIEENKNNIKKIQAQIDKLNKELGELKQSIESLQEEIDEIKALKEKIKIKEKELNILRVEQRALEILCDDIFNDRGFPLKLLKDYIERLNEYINSYFLPRVKPDIAVEIKIEQDKIEINIAQNGYTRELATYSGGEKTIVGLAFRLGIAKILSSSRLGVVPKMLIIDEGFGPLSKEFREAVLKAILELRQDYEKIFIISHVEDIQENPLFDSIVRIWKDEAGFSHIEILK